MTSESLPTASWHLLIYKTILNTSEVMSVLGVLGVMDGWGGSVVKTGVMRWSSSVGGVSGAGGGVELSWVSSRDRSDVRNRSEGGGGGLDDGCGDRQGLLADDGVEAVERISDVVDRASGAIGVDQRVAALYHVAVATLRLALLVAGMCVRHAVVERVLGMAVELAHCCSGMYGLVGVRYDRYQTGVGHRYQTGKS